MIKTAVLILFLLICSCLYAEEAKVPESDQQIDNFSLAGFGDKGKKTWELSGKSADIFDEVVKLKSVEGKLYGKEEDVNLTADKGDFNKTDGKVHLEDNVVITTSSGTQLTTDSLDWDRKNQLVTTNDVVNIERDGMVTSGTGAVGQMGLKKVSLEKDVKVDILPKDKEGKPPKPGERIIATCDGPLEVDYQSNIATFKNNVKVEREGSIIYCDRLDIYFIAGKKDDAKQQAEESKQEQPAPGLMGSKIDKLFARGNVKIVQGENVSYSDEATYNAIDKKIILSGKPKLLIYSSEGLNNAPTGN